MWNHQQAGGKAARISAILGDLKGVQFRHAVEVVDSTLGQLEKIGRGVIPLDGPDYFHAIIEAMNRAPRGTRVHAVNTIDELRWKHDPREVMYLEANLAALKRGVTINRIFVLSRTQFFAGDPQERLEILREQTGHDKLKVWIMWKEKHPCHESKFRDWVAFDKPSVVLYTDYADPIDHTRVSHGEMVVNERDITEFLSRFSILRDAAMSADMFIDEVESELFTYVAR